MNEFTKLESQLVKDVVDPMDELLGTTSKETDTCPKTKIEINNNINNLADKLADVGLCDDDYDAGF